MRVVEDDGGFVAVGDDALGWEPAAIHKVVERTTSHT